MQYGDFELSEHRVATQDNEYCTVYRIEREEAQLVNARRTPVILLHGSYSNRHFWLSPKGVGFAAYLFDAEFDVWIMEFRGHGNSPRSNRYRHYGAKDWAYYDLPAVQAFVSRQNALPAYWIGHSAGGLAFIGAVARRALDKHLILGACMLGTQTTHGKLYLRNPFVYWGIRLAMAVLGKLPAKKLGFGPEDESPLFIKELMDWKRHHKWTDHQGNDVWDGLSELDFPLLIVTSDGDEQDPKAGVEQLFERIDSHNKQFLCLGIDHGHRRDYSHVGMLIDKDAQAEVWPLLKQWLFEHQS